MSLATSSRAPTFSARTPSLPHQAGTFRGEHAGDSAHRRRARPTFFGPTPSLAAEPCPFRSTTDANKQASVAPTLLELVLARHEVEAAISIMKKSWWPVITVVVAVGLSA
jgi:hypothetical protein